MFELSDIAIILICGATCLYCFVLGRRLAALQNTKDGLGAAIVTFSRSVSDISSTARNTTSRASELAIQLADLIEQAHKACQKVDEVTSQIEAQRGQALDDLKSTQSDLHSLIAEARTVQINQSSRMQSTADELFGQSESAFTEDLSASLRNELRQRTDRMKAIVDYDAP